MAGVKTPQKKASSTKITKETYLAWYESMLRQRRFEEKAAQFYGKQIRGFLHLYIGQEAVSAGIVSATRKEDPLITAYRDHGLGLAKGISCKEGMAELFGKITGCTKGKGGSMHFFSKKNYFFGGHGIVGGQIPLGAGIAFAEKYKGTKNVTVCLFGDGASRQGSLHETFNMAMTWKLPVVFICENNHYAMGTSVERTSNVTDLSKLALSYNMPSQRVDGMVPEAVHVAVEKAVEYARKGNGPTLLEALTYRYKGHSMSDPAKYRTKEEVDDYKGKDPIQIILKKIEKNKYATKKQIEDINNSIKEEIEEAVQFAEESDYPPIEDLFSGAYQQQDYPFIKD
ncbi:MAG: pyruvate dehydrogenase (acetyl-transferring) E1 component subunit alpha [Bacteroidetes bacterium]|nr:pyruvate dehydrogenase (acetyl-transferring) E1 component subunit alpha [Bacteroidota bacterium]